MDTRSLASKLLAEGMRPARRAVCDAVDAMREPFDVRGLVGASGPLLRDVSRASIYRTLRLLLEHGLVSAVFSPAGERIYYTGAMPGDVLLYCEACGRSRMTRKQRMANLLDEAARKAGFRRLPAAVLVVARCSTCARPQARAA